MIGRLTPDVTFSLLDQGYMKLIQAWGSDEQIVEAARMSTQKGFLGWEPGPCPTCGGHGTVTAEVWIWEEEPDFIRNAYGQLVKVGGVGDYRSMLVSCISCSGKGEIRGDMALLRYLREHRHTTPFEMAGLIVEVKAPILVFREWHRHRTQSYNEMSARYIPLPDENYLPSLERFMMAAGKNKQAAAADGSRFLTKEAALRWRQQLQNFYQLAEMIYQDGLQIGIPKELARCCIPVGRYSAMRASANLKNWLDFMTLRSAPDAQWEIRQYSDAIGNLVSQLFPRTWQLFEERKR